MANEVIRSRRRKGTPEEEGINTDNTHPSCVILKGTHAFFLMSWCSLSMWVLFVLSSCCFCLCVCLVIFDKHRHWLPEGKDCQGECLCASIFTLSIFPFS